MSAARPSPRRLVPACLVPALLALPLLLGACRTAAPAAPAAVRIGAMSAARAVPAHDNLNAVLWMQSAEEYRAVALGTYRAAEARLADALDDTTWSADPFQARGGGFGRLPAAVVLDVDETVLDNSPYQARSAYDGTPYDPATWGAWVREGHERAIPGALDYTRAAAARGIRVVYLTNRRADEEAPTAARLAALGFPIADGDAILTRGERPGWAASDKDTRRAFVAGRYRILQYLGDNLGDFLGHENDTPEARRQMTAPYDAWWGMRWFALPNPTYGSWETALTRGLPAGSPADSARAAKRRALRVER